MALPVAPIAESLNADQTSGGSRDLDREMGQRHLISILAEGQLRQASDIHLRVGGPALLRIDGELSPGEDRAFLTASQTQAFCDQALTMAGSTRTSKEDRDIEVAIDDPNSGRWRVIAYRERGHWALVLRSVRRGVPDLATLGIPAAVTEWARATTGLVIVAGPTGSGKSTTLAALVALINAESNCHILTIEDPVEFLHEPGRASLSQREVGTDTESFAQALRSGLRQDPDVIVIGEIRDAQTLQIALQASQTGHLVLASLHAGSTAEVVDRMIDMVDPGQREHTRISASRALVGILSQRLVRSETGSRVLVCEVATATRRMRDAIAGRSESTDIEAVLAESGYAGMQTFTVDLVRLVSERHLTVAEALSAFSHAPDVRVALHRAGHRE